MATPITRAPVMGGIWPQKALCRFCTTALAAAAELGSHGFLADTGFPILSGNMVDVQGHVLDAWQAPLRIEFDGATGVRVWSIGADGIAETSDDILSGTGSVR